MTFAPDQHIHCEVYKHMLQCMQDLSCCTPCRRLVKKKEKKKEETSIIILMPEENPNGYKLTKTVFSPCWQRFAKQIKVQNPQKTHWCSQRGCISPKQVAVCRPGLLLTSAGTSRLLPKCWLKDRHQASVYPFMLGTYFFTVSSLSLSQTPSSLWIYGGKQATGCGHGILLL